MPDDTKVAPSVEADAEAPELEAGTEIAGYVIDGTIGHGGMGKVYGAHHPRIGKRVAIKVLARSYCDNQSAVARFEQEARIVNEIRHPNIVDVFQFGELPDKRSFFVMELLTGETLSARIDKAPLSTPEAIGILDDVCDALEAAHEHGVVHRDLKSDNIFLATTRGKTTVKLLDFGIAKLGGRTEPTTVGKTASGIIVGTPAYMSPEQARGQSVSARTDVYQLGVLAFKMVTGKLPFNADNPMDLIIEHLKTPPPSPRKLAPGVPEALSRLIVRMMGKDPEARPSVAEVRSVFGELRGRAPTKKQTASPPASRPASPSTPPQSPRRATRVLLALTVFLVGFVAVGAFFLIRERSNESAVAPSALPATGSVETAPPPSPEPAAATTDPVEIEMEPAPVGTPSDASIKKRSKRDAAVDLPAEDTVPPDRPGAILFTLQINSTIEIDGTTVAQASTGGRFEVKPGTHEIRVMAPGRQVVTRSIEVLPGGVAVISIEDDPNAK